MSTPIGDLRGMQKYRGFAGIGVDRWHIQICNGQVGACGAEVARAAVSEAVLAGHPDNQPLLAAQYVHAVALIDCLID